MEMVAYKCTVAFPCVEMVAYKYIIAFSCVRLPLAFPQRHFRVSDCSCNRYSTSSVCPIAPVTVTAPFPCVRLML